MEEKIKIDVSIIIVNYNGLELVSECLKSLVKYSITFSYEIIIIDNNSKTGNIEDILKNYNNTILIKNSQNLGFSVANNQGLAIARGEYILLLNNDTVFVENSIQKVLEFIKQKGEDVLVGCKLLNQDLSVQKSVSNFPSIANVLSSNLFLYKIFPNSPVLNKYYLSRKLITDPIEVDVVIGAFIFSSRKTLNKLKGFDERFFFYFEEIDLCYRLKMNGGKVYYYPSTKVIHLGGATTEKMPWFKYRNQVSSYIQFYQKHFKGINFIIVILLHYFGLIIRIPISLVAGLILQKKSYVMKSYYCARQLCVYPKNVF
ncbi:MAG: glycosyltransferase family 2 protein [Bacteroidota bacterium]|nr:glycosyltransferase family 2 protein [Bacteroidota bacterium]